MIIKPFPTGQYSLIYADPCWEQKMYSDKGYEKSPEMHYDTMTLDELKSMRDHVVFATAPNSVMVMWTMFHMIDQALDLMHFWGFQYKTGGPWIKRTVHGKNTFGTGYILRGSAELFLIGTHGKPKIKNRATRNLLITGEWPEDIEDIPGIIVDTQRRDHSRKPDEIIPLIENLFNGPYLELFARTERPGWSVWGNETDKFSEAAA